MVDAKNWSPAGLFVRSPMKLHLQEAEGGLGRRLDRNFEEKVLDLQGV